jgi:hypothetical protein
VSLAHQSVLLTEPNQVNLPRPRFLIVGCNSGLESHV